MDLDDEPVSADIPPRSGTEPTAPEFEPRDAAAADELLEGVGGCWQVSTDASLHVLDLDRRRVRRVPGGGGGVAPVAALRRDHAEVRLLRVCRCRVGEPMVLLIVVREDTVPTIRTTTVVRAIRPLTASAGQAPLDLRHGKEES